jgi:hypothetical protein
LTPAQAQLGSGFIGECWFIKASAFSSLALLPDARATIPTMQQGALGKRQKIHRNLVPFHRRFWLRTGLCLRCLKTGLGQTTERL